MVKQLPPFIMIAHILGSWLGLGCHAVNRGRGWSHLKASSHACLVPGLGKPKMAEGVTSWGFSGIPHSPCGFPPGFSPACRFQSSQTSYFVFTVFKAQRDGCTWARRKPPHFKKKKDLAWEVALHHLDIIMTSSYSDWGELDSASQKSIRESVVCVVK